MKKIILISLLTISFAFAQAQKKTVIPNGATIQGRDLTGTKIDGYDATKTKVDNAVPSGNSLVLKSDSSNQKPGSYVTRYDFKNEYVGQELEKIYKSIGLKFKAYPLVPLALGTSINMTDNRLIGQLIYVRDTTLMTGMTYNLNTAATVYTGDQTNGFALYKILTTTISKVAETANTPTMWTQIAGANYDIPFTASYTAYPGFYYTTCLANWSAATVVPKIPSQGISDLLNMAASTNYVFSFYFSGQNSFAASYNISSLAGATNQTIYGYLLY